MLTDVLTSCALCFYLNKLRTGYSKSDSTVSSLTRYAVNCGVLTSAFSLATVITVSDLRFAVLSSTCHPVLTLCAQYDLLPGKFVFMSFYFIVSKLYAVSFLATLNTRTLIRGRGTDNEQPKSTFIMYDTSTRPDTGPGGGYRGGMANGGVSSGGGRQGVMEIIQMKVRPLAGCCTACR